MNKEYKSLKKPKYFTVVYLALSVDLGNEDRYDEAKTICYKLLKIPEVCQ